ncbi:MAG: flippase [Fibrobacterota bacterium]|nr:flippase [Fibrobacterota bacterium]QQS06345.1 MAG: flippase [Fibrobacterota bacterium]
MSAKSIKINAALNMIKTAAGMIFPLITFPYTSRILGPEGVGKVNFANSFLAYFILLASIGIPVYGIRAVAKVRENIDELALLVKELIVLHLIASGVAFLAFLGVILVSDTVSAEAWLFFVVSFSIPLSMFTLDWFYQGMEDYAYITKRSIGFSVLAIGAMFMLVKKPQDYVLYAGITVVASLGSSVLNFWNARKVVFRKSIRSLNLKQHIRPLGSVFALNFIISIYINLDTVMLGFLSKTDSVGYYSSAMKLTKMLLSLVSSFSAVLLPRLSYYAANDQLEKFDEMLRKSLGVILLMCIPASAGLMLVGREIILVLAGDLYLEAVSCVIITAPIILIIGLNGVFGYQILYSLGREKAFLFSVAVGAILNVAINFALIPRFNHIGASIGALVAEAAILFIQIFLVRTRHHVKWPWVSLLKYVGATAVMALALIVFKSNTEYLLVGMKLSACVLIGASVYFGLLYFMHDEFVVDSIRKLQGWVKREKV